MAFSILHGRNHQKSKSVEMHSARHQNKSEKRDNKRQNIKTIKNCKIMNLSYIQSIRTMNEKPQTLGEIP